MKQETFFEKFDQFADAPDAVAKMRELILRLAMQGKLVCQNPRDEPADGLVLELKAEAADKNGRRPAPLPPIAPDEIPFELPVGWVWERLGNIGETNIGLTYSPQDVSDVGTPVLRSSNVQNGKLDFDDLVRVTCEPKQSVMVQEGDLLICARNGSRALVGKVALIENLKEPAAFGAFMAIFRSRVNTFLYHFICSPLFRRMIDEVNTTTINQITQNNLRSTLAPIPPLAEQKRIVAKVDELMALCDRLEAQQQERETRHAALARASLARFADAPTPANLPFLFHPSYTIPPADLRKSILTLAVQGKLVHRIESEGIGSDILKKAGVSEESPNDVPDLPVHWMWARLGSIATRMDSGWSPACIPEPAAKGEWGVLKTTAVQTLQYQEVQNKALPPNLEPRPEHEVMDGDILFTRAGPMNRVGILCVARPTRKKLMISDKIIRFHLIAGIDPDFAALSMNAGFSSTVVEGLKSGMAASQVNISQPKLRSVPIPLPPLAEQRRIVAKVEQLMALVDALETQLAASRATAANLLSALVAELTVTA